MSTFLYFIKSKRILLALSTVIVSIVLWNTHTFFKTFREQEKIKMEILADTYFELNKATPEQDIGFLGKIIQKNNSIPLIITDMDGNILLDQNITYSEKNKNKTLSKKLKEMKKSHPPIELNLLNGKNQYIYYTNSEILNQLKYYPIGLVIVFLLFLLIIYFVLNASSVSDKNKLWNGMAKETAHQIGTPLSSLLGWVEILRSENIDQSYVNEIQKDVEHLSIIANRFSKIGSDPITQLSNPAIIIEEIISYFEARSSEKIIFNFNKPLKPVEIKLNNDLFRWVLENIFKNAIDAMRGKGNITIQLLDFSSEIQILITDTGKGIPKNLQKKIFAPGFTTKERGWGIGLSLTKRIISQYHKGKIFVKQSQQDVGTTFQINIPK